jgi:hypothetical protein
VIRLQHDQRQRRSREVHAGGVTAMIGWCNEPRSVMLHRCVRYVSKAAIFEGRALLGVGRKSKSRLNSKGLDRLALLLAATVFPLRV